jgi:GDP-L-fucose synthase
MHKKDKIFVAGASGLVGSAIVRTLQAKGYTNVIGSYHSRKPDPSLITHHSSLVTEKIDLTSQTQVADFFSDHRPSYVFLAAAKVGGIMANNTYRADFIYDNLQIQNNIIHQSYLSGVKKLLFLGSTCIYPKEAPQPMPEDSLLTGPLEYTNEPYAMAKIAGIKMCESYNLQYGTNFISVMPTNLYGPGDNFDLETSHVLPALLRKMHLAKLASQGDLEAIEQDELRFGPIPDEILRDLGVERKALTAEAQSTQGEDKSDDLSFAADQAAKEKGSSQRSLRLSGEKPLVRIWGTGKPLREFLWSEDMAQACLYLMERVDFQDLAQGLQEVRNTHINIGSGREISIRELAETIRERVGLGGRLDFDTSKPDGTMRKLTDVSKLHSLGWRHSIDLAEGVDLLYDWYLKKRQ